jgi:cytochrome P450
VPTSILEAQLPEFDVRGPEFCADPLGTLARARSVSPVARSHRGIELLSYDLASRLFADERFDTAGVDHYRKLGAPPAVLRFVEDGLLSTMERERHNRVRRVLARAFTLRRIEEQKVLMLDVGRRLLDKFQSQGSCDLVADFTDPYPMEVLCRLIGVPSDDIEEFAQHAHDLHLLAAVPMNPGFPQLERAYLALEAYVTDLLEQRRTEPRADFVSALIQAQETEGRLTEAELVGNIVNLLFAGAGTTRFQLASAVYAAVENGLWDRLAAEVDLLPGALEESMRFFPVTQFVVRIPLEDAAFGGYLFPKGTRTIVNLWAASRDSAHFARPDDFDVTRGDTRSRLPFGWGVHHCIGHALARTQMLTALSVLTSELTAVKVESREIRTPPGAMLGGPDVLRISFRPR